MKITEVPGNPGAPAIVLYYEYIEDHVTHSTDVHSRIKILTEAGRKYADVRIPYMGGYVTDVKARTVHPDGTISELSSKVLDGLLTKNKELEARLASFALPYVKVGDIVEYRYSIHGIDLSQGGNEESNEFYGVEWNIQKELFQRSVHYNLVPFKPAGLMHVRAIPYLPKAVAVKQVGKSLDLKMSDVPPLVEEPYTPRSVSYGYRVRFVATRPESNDEFVKSRAESWNNSIAHFLGDKKDLQEAVAKIVAGTDTPEQKVRKIYEYMAQFRNTTFTGKITKAEMESLGLTDRYTASAVIRAKLGRGRDLTRLFVGLVRAVDIPAVVARVTPKDENYLPEDIWTRQKTELAIVRVDNKDVFLDPGTPRTPYGMLNWRFTGANGIRQGADGKGMEYFTTPAPTYKDAVIKRLAVLTLGSDGELNGKLTIAYFGQAALRHRLKKIKSETDGRKGYLQEQLRDILPTDSKVSLINEPAWDTSTDPLLAEFKVTIPALNSAGRRSLMAMHLFDFNHPAVFTASTRTNPIYFDYPYVVQDEVRVTLPDGFTPETLPTNEKVAQNFGTYIAEYRRKGQELIASRVFAVTQNTFAVEQYPQLKAFFEKVKAGDDQQIVLNSGSAIAAQ